MRIFFLTALVVAGAATSVHAADEARERYQRERAACMGGQSHQDRATCLREAGAAYQEARRNRLDSGTDRYEANALQRCQTLPSQDRTECEARMRSGKTTGSVEGGGLLREHRTIVPAGAAGSGSSTERRPAQ